MYIHIINIDIYIYYFTEKGVAAALALVLAIEWCPC